MTVDIAVRGPHTSPAVRRRVGPWVCLVAAAACWATYTPVTSVALNARMPVSALLFVQVAAATAVLWSAVVLRGRGPVPNLGRIAMLGVLEPGANCTFFSLGLTVLPSAASSLLLSSESVLVAVLGVLVLGERLGRPGWAGLGAGVLGLWVLSGAQGTGGFSPGALLVIAATGASAIYCVTAARVMRDDRVDVIATTAWQYNVGLLCVGALAAGQLVADPGRLAAQVALIPAPVWATAAAGGLLLAVPSLLYNAAIRHIPIAAAGVVLNLIPVLGAAIGVLALGDRLAVHQVVGAAVTVAGIVLLTARR
ncbi:MULTISPECIES: DMT family transporter [unclassified Nonomuraea]|uniref:DMT family transporter n=1 Tax=unclassified Nonomuraea TaxID=2593643 RepID=UPI0033D61D01